MDDCSGCVCYYCLYYWSSRCPYGKCRDDWRAVNDPCRAEVRKLWSDWDKPGEQERYCRGGFFKPAEECVKFVEYQGQIIEECYRANTQVFQDGYRICSMITNGSCEQCLIELNARIVVT